MYFLSPGLREEREEEAIYLLITLVCHFAASRRHGPASGVRQDPPRRADTQSGRMLITSIAVILVKALRPSVLWPSEKPKDSVKNKKPGRNLGYPRNS